MKPSKPSRKISIGDYPESLDWSNYTLNKETVSYTDPVYNQMSCGSCYAFGSLEVLESRILIATNRAIDVSLSQQDIVSCSSYSQGCAGGFGHEVGNYAKDHGVVSNKCFPYSLSTGRTPDNQTYTIVPDCEAKCNVTNFGTPGANQIFYAENVGYIGGYYGNCNENYMIEALQDGPIAISIWASAPEFRNASSNDIINVTTDQASNHLILLTGYGVDKTDPENPIPFWKVKNSWGPVWGDSGYIRIYRGANSLNIEDEAEIITPSFYGLTIPKTESGDNNNNEKTYLIVVIVVSVVAAILLLISIIFIVLYVRSKSLGSAGYEKV